MLLNFAFSHFFPWYSYKTLNILLLTSPATSALLSTPPSRIEARIAPGRGSLCFLFILLKLEEEKNSQIHLTVRLMIEYFQCPFSVLSVVGDRSETQTRLNKNGIYQIIKLRSRKLALALYKAGSGGSEDAARLSCPWHSALLVFGQLHSASSSRHMARCPRINPQNDSDSLSLGLTHTSVSGLGEVTVLKASPMEEEGQVSPRKGYSPRAQSIFQNE